ncbi:30S ribosomal protein S19e [archaeon]|nr:30S ribosomal protein S19e [archaeon]
MATVKSVNTQQLLEKVAGKLPKEGIETPEWAEHVKTGVYAERPPEDANWWYIRSASILRKIQLSGPIGTNKLRNWYGAAKNRGSKPEKHKKAGGKIIRTSLQQLEKAGLIKTEKGRGRLITPKGQSLLEKTASEIGVKK